MDRRDGGCPPPGSRACARSLPPPFRGRRTKRFRPCRYRSEVREFQLTSPLWGGRTAVALARGGSGGGHAARIRTHHSAAFAVTFIAARIASSRAPKSFSLSASL